MYLCGKLIKEVDMENIAFSRVEDILAKSAMEFDRKIAAVTSQMGGWDKSLGQFANYKFNHSINNKK